ncbi:MAG: hypothetical protein AUJ70_01655 [Candidatus Omnitrophica bacterium CG1_02_40_15]|nr:MAG: hypothetical protein AUJ70_01655 [Candidatus Omnitrophica bacterium CG1_02_40_15]
MSIVNDALKKAGKGFDPKDRTISVGGRRDHPLSNPDRKWIAIITASLVIIASLFGSLILYKSMSRSNAFVEAGFKSTPTSVIQSALNNIEQKAQAGAMRSQDVVKLSGIMYGDKGRWAIVNNRIVKEGDRLLGGEITSITKDLVKIEKNDGSEIVLSLK